MPWRGHKSAVLGGHVRMYGRVGATVKAELQALTDTAGMCDVGILLYCCRGAVPRVTKQSVSRLGAFGRRQASRRPTEGTRAKMTAVSGATVRRTQVPTRMGTWF